ncbi:MAG: hypothetical protein U5J97_03420 [Trueperaceae bacterium]|nr:hypothetical protein [Trueperaceae bacterium]
MALLAMPIAFGQSHGSETGIHAYIERLTTALSAPTLTPRPSLVVDVDAYLAAKARRASQDDMLASYQRWGGPCTGAPAPRMRRWASPISCRGRA